MGLGGGVHGGRIIGPNQFLLYACALRFAFISYVLCISDFPLHLDFVLGGNKTFKVIQFCNTDTHCKTLGAS